MSLPPDIAEAVATLRERALEWRNLPPIGKAALLRECLPRFVQVAPAWVKDAVANKRMPEALAGEEWLAGPVPAVRLLRLFIDSLDMLGKKRELPLGTGVRENIDGRLVIDLLPGGALDRSLFAGFSGWVLCNAGVDQRIARRAQARLYREPPQTGVVTLILGAGNVSNIPPMDVVSKLVGEGKVCLLKMNPVNEWLTPHLERAFLPLISRGFLRIVRGDAALGAALVEHEDIDEIHITGSDKTYDRIVWGPPEEAEKRRREHKPRLQKPITSELGNVSPVAIVPGSYSDDELWFQARSVVSMVVNNASFNCNAGKLLVTSKRWPQRDRFFSMLAEAFQKVPPRYAYYPGAGERYQALTSGRDPTTFGAPSPGKLPWALIRNVNGAQAKDPLFHTEPFCGILTDVVLGGSDPVEFLDGFTRFANDTAWGTLNVCIVIGRGHEKDHVVSQHLDRAISELRYGTVAINHWPAVAYASGILPWGGHPSSTPENIQSGLGWVHNPLMLGEIEKAVLRGPLTTWAHPPWFFDHPRQAELGRELLRLESGAGFRALPRLFWHAVRR